MSGVPYHAWTHAPKAEGGTDPISPSGGTAAALLTDFQFDDDGKIASETWTTVAGDADRYFTEAWISDDGWTLDMEFGTIGRSDNGLYVAYASVTLPDVIVDGGTHIGVAVQFAGSAGHFHPNTSIVEANERVEVSATWWGNMNTPTQIYAWHNAPVASFVGIADLVVRRFELTADGEFSTYQPS